MIIDGEYSPAAADHYLNDLTSSPQVTLGPDGTDGNLIESYSAALIGNYLILCIKAQVLWNSHTKTVDWFPGLLHTIPGL